MSERILASPWFLASTAIVTGLFTALTSWLAVDASDGVRLLAVLIGVVAGIGVMLLVAWALPGEEEAGPPEATPVETAPAAMPPPTALPVELEKLLERGRALLQELEPGASDARVGQWIAEVRVDLKPGVAGYFDALGKRAYADDRERLDAHVSRLATITRDFV